MVLYLPPHVFVSKAHYPKAHVEKIWELLVTVGLAFCLNSEEGAGNRLQLPLSAELRLIIQQLQLLNDVLHYKARVD